MPLSPVLSIHFLFIYQGHCLIVSLSHGNLTYNAAWSNKQTVVHFLPPPPTPPLSTATKQSLKVVTGGDQFSVASAQNVIRNHQAFIQKHGYAYEVHTGNYAYPWIAYWHKIDVLLRELRAPSPPKVLAWFDLDLIVTNPSLHMLEDILTSHPDEKVILTEDAHRGSLVPGKENAKRLVNTGIILVRTGPEAERVFEKLLEYGRENRNAAYLPQDTNTLHEQDAFNALLSGPRKHVWRRHVAVIPQRSGGLNLNTFSRNIYDAHFEDPVHAEWQTGDFTAHCTGLRKQLREWCITDSLEAGEVQLSLSAEHVCKNRTSYMDPERLGHVDFYKMESTEALVAKGSDVLGAYFTDWLRPTLISI